MTSNNTPSKTATSESDQEIVTLSFTVMHDPEEGRGYVDIADIDPDAGMEMSATMQRFIEQRFDTFLGDHVLAVDHASLQETVALVDYQQTPPETGETYYLSDAGYGTLVGDPVIGASTTIVYTSPDTNGNEKAQGTLIEAAPHEMDGIRYWKLTVETDDGQNVTASTLKQGTEVTATVDGETRVLGTLVDARVRD